MALTLILLAVVVVAVSALARRVSIPVPLVLIGLGMAGSFVPGMPTIELTADVVLIGLLPPLLYSAALRTSLVDFNANRRPILLLSIGLVVFTTVGVAAAVHAVLPGVSWPAALALGAVVAPPDAVAATAIARRIGLPRRVVTILEGESLLNDATALVALRTAIAGSTTAWAVAWDFGLAAVGGVVVGLAVFLVVGWVRKHLEDPLLDSALSFVTPFAAYVAAETIHASGVLAVVIAGLLLGHTSPVLQTATSRVVESMNWRSIAFVLENAVFLLIGLQAQSIVRDVGESEVSTARVIAVCTTALLAVVLLRFAWLLPLRALLLRVRRASGEHPPSWSETVIVGWAGMRGAVTLAAAFVIPPDFPQREVLVLTAFTVTVGTLFLQGLTLPTLARLLRVEGPDPGEDALARANLLHQAANAGLEALDEIDGEDPHDVRAMVRQRVEQRSFAARERLGNPSNEGETPSEAYARMRRHMLDAERARVLEIRSSGTVAHEVVEEVLAMLDLEESMLDNVTRVQQRLQAPESVVASPSAAGCEHLRAAVDEVPAATPGECPSCRREGLAWVHLRRCLTCGHVGCCDSSTGRHATRHFEETGHPVMRSAEEGDDWRWCYVDHLTG